MSHSSLFVFSKMDTLAHSLHAAPWAPGSGSFPALQGTWRRDRIAFPVLGDPQMGREWLAKCGECEVLLRQCSMTRRECRPCSAS